MSEEGWIYLLCGVAIVVSLASIVLTVLNVLITRAITRR